MEDKLLIKWLGDTTHGGATSTSEDRFRVQPYLEELKETVWKIVANSVRTQFCAWGTMSATKREEG